MRFNIIGILAFSLFMVLTSIQAIGQVTSGNPIIRHIRSADPSAQVWEDGKVWVYTSHDPDGATDYSTMEDYHVFSSEDLIEWTDHGVILSSADVSWAVSQGGFMFAPDAAYKDGIYYLFFPTMAEGWKWRVGVASSEKPEGPFTDVGHYIEGTDEIDPTCFVDDDGEAYLIWGGGANAPKIARLKENMTELAEEPRIIEYGASNFGEGPFMHKRDGIYYFSYTCNTCYPYQGYYSMADNPYGPFEYKGNLKKSPPGAQDHHSMIEYHGQWYYFYHTGNYGPGASLYQRNVCVDSLFYNEDGTMQEVIQTTTGVGQDIIGKTPGILIPGRVEAEAFFRHEGIDTLEVNDSSTVVTGIKDGDWLDYVLEILGSEVYQAEMKIAKPAEGTKIYILVDEKMQDSISVEAGSDTLRISIFLHKGKHTLKFLFSNDDQEALLMDMDWIDLFGEKVYYSITATANEGGSIDPEGIVYVTAGDSLAFLIDWDLTYKADSLLIDGIPHAPSHTYIFRNVTENHVIEAGFEPCEGTLLSPFYQVNSEEAVNSPEASASEGDDLKLLVEFEDTGVLTWIDPRGKTSTGNTFDLENILVGNAGTYTAYFINSQGCQSQQSFIVTVDPFVLDVYQAENWIGKSGILNEICRDFGGGLNVGFIDNDDWCMYNIDIGEGGIYDFTARVATEADGGEIELSTDDQVLGTVNVSGSSSDGWQDWYTTEPLELEFEKGRHDLKLTFKGGDGRLFNLNWFDLEFNRASPVSIPGKTLEGTKNLVHCFPLPDGSGFGIEYKLDQPSDVSIQIINMAGVQTRTLVAVRSQDAGTYSLHWEGENNAGERVSDGIYLLLYSANGRLEVRKLFLLN